MCDERQHSDEPQSDALDALLKRVGRHEIPADQIARLNRHWKQINKRRRRHQVLGTALLLAVAAGIAGSLYALRSSNNLGGGRRDIVAVDTDVEPTVQPTAAREDESQRGAERAFERLVKIAAKRHMRRDRSEVPLETPENERLTLDDILAITARRIQGGEDVSDMVEQARERFSEQHVLGRMARSNDPHTTAAALHLLSIVATQRSIPALLRLRTNPVYYEPATRLIATIADEHTLFALTRQEANAHLQRELAAALLRHPSGESLPLFLQLVDDSRASAAALAAVADSDTIPIDRLFEYMGARQRNLRLTAALVLGRSNDTRATRQLVELAHVNELRQAALVALIASENDLARQFVDQARHDIYWAASVHAASVLVRSFPVDS